MCHRLFQQPFVGEEDCIPCDVQLIFVNRGNEMCHRLFQQPFIGEEDCMTAHQVSAYLYSGRLLVVATSLIGILQLYIELTLS